MHYLIVSATESSEAIVKKVNDKTKEGYVPLGGVSVVLESDGYLRYSQAMVNTQKEPDSASGS